MKYIIILVFISVPFSIQAQEIRLTLPIKFLALGDSYTIGQSVDENERWPVQLVNELQKNSIATEELKIIAQTGWRTDNLIGAIRAANLTSDYNLVSLLIGVNNQYQGRDFAQYEREFEELLNMAINLAGGDKESVFVLSIPDYGYTPFGQSNKQNISAEIDKYNKTNRVFSLQYGVTYINITSISREGLDNPELVATDGLHPSGKMYAEWVKLILKEVYIEQTSSVNTSTNQWIDVRYDPANSKIYVDNLEEQENSHQYRIRNITGSIIKSGRLFEKSIDIPGVEPGVYIIEISGKDFETAEKLLVY